MLEAIGFEGFAADDVPLTFGAAAFREDDQLVNGVTWTAAPIATWDKYVAKKVVTPITSQKIAMTLKKPVMCMVLRCSRNIPTFLAIGEWFSSNANYFYAWRDPSWGYWLVAFDVMKPLAAHVLKWAQDRPEYRAQMERHAYILDHEKDPRFQAMLAGK